MRSRLDNARKPEGFRGSLVLSRMNRRHQAGERWGAEKLDFSGVSEILDVGCGGGQGLAMLHSLAPDARITGLDYSPVSVKKSVRRNRRAIRSGKVAVLQSDVARLPFPKASFDIVTAFETVYFWPDITRCFENISRVLRPGGAFLVCNEVSEQAQFDAWGEGGAMRFYSPETLRDLMLSRGFASAEISRHPEGRWMCVLGRSGSPETPGQEAGC